ncbi:MAG: tryptophan synthase subunit alpha [Proteobacteria bacterium]|nr:tryptophan synthase subunit alpha [Pseudomonadota bacterium]MCH8177209.1 tryptophan synthase subunit alpha [Pseudomonadota bacterium]
MSQLGTCFRQLAAQNKKALIPFVTAGDPDPGFTVELMHELVTAGADIIELGVPFSDPMADGPVIQAADERALKHHVSLTDVVSMVSEFRRQDKSTPIVLMGYLNPVEILGYERFSDLAEAAGVDGILIVDMPPEEAGEFSPLMREKQIDVIYLVSPTTNAERIKLINDQASGYLYYVSLKGVTGASTLDVNAVAEKIDEIKTISTLPIGVGFGIKDGQTAQAVAKIADAVIVGSALVKQVELGRQDYQKIKNRISGILREMRSMMDTGNGSIE